MKKVLSNVFSYVSSIAQLLMLLYSITKEENFNSGHSLYDKDEYENVSYDDIHADNDAEVDADYKYQYIN
jgi:hypothetical protein